MFGTIYKRENIAIPSLYFAHERDVVRREVALGYPNSEFLVLRRPRRNSYN